MNNLVLEKLKENSGQYVSGQILSEMLGVSRTAVWKYISDLKKDGYIIDASSKKGYRLILSSDVLNSSEISYGLKTDKLGKTVYYFDEIDSTNSYAKKAASEGCGDGTVIVADCQKSGKGRLGRQWNSGPGTGIWMSVVLRPDILPEDIQVITLAASVAVVRAIKAVTGIITGIKWPNDIILDGKKVCGILTEISTEMEQVNFLVLGIGINVNHTDEDFPEDLSKVATSLRLYSENKCNYPNEQICGKIFNRSEIIKGVLIELEGLYENIKKGNIRGIIDGWKKYSVTLGKEVIITIRNSKYTGVAQDITVDGRLRVACSDGVVREVLSGEVSVRGLLGYV